MTVWTLWEWINRSVCSKNVEVTYVQQNKSYFWEGWKPAVISCASTRPNFLNPVAHYELQPLDAALLHLLPADRGLLRAQHVRGRGGGELPQVPAPPGGRRGQAQGGEETETHGEKETE